MVREGLGVEKDGIVIPFSAETKQGREEIWELIDRIVESQEGEQEDSRTVRP